VCSRKRAAIDHQIQDMNKLFYQLPEQWHNFKLPIKKIDIIDGEENPKRP